MAKEKNPICGFCKKDIDLVELSMIEQAEALEGKYIHTECLEWHDEIQIKTNKGDSL